FYEQLIFSNRGSPTATLTFQNNSIMKNYIDVKVTVWNRLHFSEESNMKGIADLIQQEGIEEVIDDKLGFAESETLYDTEERLEPRDNGGQATIEVYEDGKEVWNNEIK